MDRCPQQNGGKHHAGQGQSEKCFDCLTNGGISYKCLSSHCNPQDILDYLSMFQEDTSTQGYSISKLDGAHPALIVVDAFKTPEIAATTFNKLMVFLEDACKALGKNFIKADSEATCLFNMYAIKSPYESTKNQRINIPRLRKLETKIVWLPRPCR